MLTFSTVVEILTKCVGLQRAKADRLVEKMPTNECNCALAASAPFPTNLYEARQTKTNYGQLDQT